MCSQSIDIPSWPPKRKFPRSNKLWWTEAGDCWALFRDHSCIALLRPHVEGGDDGWITEIWQFDDLGWHGVDCPDVEGGKIILENWAHEAGLA